MNDSIVKSYRLAFVPITIWVAVAALVLWPWITTVERSTFSILMLLSASIWWFTFLWGLHHLSFQLWGLFRNVTGEERASQQKPSVAILYTTCDDFNSECCKSCLDQKYSNFRLLILDDSTTQDYKADVKKFYEEHKSPRCKLVDRKAEARQEQDGQDRYGQDFRENSQGQEGFKAGNLNFALKQKVSEEWVLLVDADQRLDGNYLSRLVSKLPSDSESISFIQTSNRPILTEESSNFQHSFSTSVPLYFFRDLSSRNQFGFVPLLGHSAMIRRSTCEQLKGFPEVVSEDYAFAMRTAYAGQSGIFVEQPAGAESIPYDFGGFMIRLRKYAGGTAELFREELLRFMLRGKAHPVERWDALLQLAWYVLMPLVVLNGFLGAYVLHELWESGQPYLHPLLPYVYAWLSFVILSLYVSVSDGVGKAVRFYFWTTAIHAAAMPLAALSFVCSLLVGKAQFKRTPKNGEKQRLNLLDSAGMALLGVGALLIAVLWRSPYSWVLAGQGTAYASYGLFGELCSESRWGRLARVAVWLPGTLMLIGLWAVWEAIGLEPW